MHEVDWKKYVFTFLITAIIFFSAITLSRYFSDKRVEEIRSIHDQISVNILSSEVQTALLEQFSCKEIGTTALSQELGSLGEKLSYTEVSRGSDDPEVMALKRNYSLLEIKDYLLMNRIREKCGTKHVFIIYFYGAKCEDCGKQSLVLTKLREDFPELRVYSFDYNLDLGALQTLISINKIEENFPALLIGDDVYYNYKNIDEMETIIPQLKVWRLENERQEKATTTAQ
jgi:hypothetical protein